MVVRTRISNYFIRLPCTGVTPFHLAVQAGHNDIVLRCLNEGGRDGANSIVGLRDREGWTPLEHAIYFERWSTARILLQHGADGGIEVNGFSLAQHVRIGESWEIFKKHVRERAIQSARERVDRGGDGRRDCPTVPRAA